MTELIEFKVAVRCRCGATHSMEVWRTCPMALVPVNLDPWWRQAGGVTGPPDDYTDQLKEAAFKVFSAT